MAATFLERIESYIGPTADLGLSANQVTSVLTAAGRWLIEILPDDVLSKGAQSMYSISSGEADITGRRVSRVFEDNRPARRIPPEMSHAAIDANSIYKATPFDPVWYIEGGRLCVKPGTGTVAAFVTVYPSITGIMRENDILVIPREAVDIIPMEAARRILRITETSFSTEYAALVGYLNVTQDYTGLEDYISDLNNPALYADLDALLLVTETVTLLDALLAARQDFANLQALVSKARNTTFIDTMIGNFSTLATEWSTFSQMLNTNQDIDLSMAKLEEIKQKIVSWATSLEMAIKSTDEREAVDLQAKIQAASNFLQMKISEVSALIDGYIKRYQLAITERQGRMDVMLKERQVLSAEVQAQVQATANQLQLKITEINSRIEGKIKEIQTKMSYKQIELEKIRLIMGSLDRSIAIALHSVGVQIGGQQE